MNLNLVEIVALVVAAVTTLIKVATVNKEFWSKVPALAHYIPGALPVLALVGEKLSGVQNTNDAVNAIVGLLLLAYGHFSKPKKPEAPPAA